MVSKPKILFSNKLYVLIHPAALALYVFLVLLFSLPNYFQKHQINIEEVINLQNLFRKHHFDMNGDSVSEGITIGYNNLESNIAVQYQDQEGKIYNQWNINGHFLAEYHACFTDFNNNGYREIFLLSIKDDSIILSAKELMNPNPYLIENRFICKAGLFKEKNTDICQYKGSFEDIDRDGYLDFIFCLNGGFSKYPRNIFVYYIHQDSLSQSPTSASIYNKQMRFMDLNNDGISEITGIINSPENIHYEIPYTDSSSWLMVIDPLTMDYLFPPIRYQLGVGSRIVPRFLKYNNQKYIGVATLPRSASNPAKQKLQIYTDKGKLLKEYTNYNIDYLFFLDADKTRDSEPILLMDNRGNIYQTDTSLKVKSYFKRDNIEQRLNFYEYELLDLDDDGKNELIFIGNNTLGDCFLNVYQPDLKGFESITLPHSSSSYQYWNLNKVTNKDYQKFSLQLENYTYLFTYDKNPFYLLKYPIYLLAYLLFFLLFWLLQRVQLFYAKKGFELEKQLMQQQMALSKKQMEPHFMLNMINNIGYFFSKNDQRNAIYYLGKFGSLMRKGLINSSESQISLEDEMEFIEDYLILQKVLMDEELNYEIYIHEQIEEDKILIPHSLVYTFVENAIKHGLRPKEKDRKLEIQVEHAETRIKITIKDNGIGRQKSKELNTTDTGKGMKIIKTIIAGYNQLYGGNINYLVEDVLDDRGQVGGTKVEIWV